MVKKEADDVVWNKAYKQWEAVVEVKGRRTSLGYFSDKDCAKQYREHFIKVNHLEYEVQ